MPRPPHSVKTRRARSTPANTKPRFSSAYSALSSSLAEGRADNAAQNVSMPSQYSQNDQSRRPPATYACALRLRASIQNASSVIASPKNIEKSRWNAQACAGSGAASRRARSMLVYQSVTATGIIRNG